VKKWIKWALLTLLVFVIGIFVWIVFLGILVGEKSGALPDIFHLQKNADNIESLYDAFELQATIFTGILFVVGVCVIGCARYVMQRRRKGGG